MSNQEEFDLIRDLKSAIRNSGVSHSKLGRMCDLNSAQISRFMRDERGLNIEAIDKICRALRLHLVAKPQKRGKETA